MVARFSNKAMARQLRGLAHRVEKYQWFDTGDELIEHIREIKKWFQTSQNSEIRALTGRVERIESGIVSHTSETFMELLSRYDNNLTNYHPEEGVEDDEAFEKLSKRLWVLADRIEA